MNGPWEITRQSETTALDPATNEYRRMIEVRFSTDQGDTGVVYVRPENYEADHVRELVNARVAAMNEVRATHG